MARGTEDHAALAVSTLAALLAAVGDRPCRVSSSDLRIYVEAVGLATFPDGSVILGPIRRALARENAVKREDTERDTLDGDETRPRMLLAEAAQA